MTGEEFRPLADRMRPRRFDEFAGQTHIVGSDSPLRRAVEAGRLHSMIFWGPPGSGKTTLARLVAASVDAEFIALSAVMAGVKDVRAAVATAEQVRRSDDRSTLIFLDEVHRFNKAQQDAFLPFVENGTFVFVGATTENPSFALNNALLSRARVYVLKALDRDDIVRVLERAMSDDEHGLGRRGLEIDRAGLAAIAAAADGDARRALGMLEVAADLASDGRITPDVVDAVSAGGLRRFDREGEAFYDQISALHKAVRGSDPDASVYWLARMLDGGCDPYYIARRLLRMASEDIGNADPRALALALDAWQTYERLGSPEGELALYQTAIFLACAAKSNAVYKAAGAALSDVKQHGSLEVPLAIRNAPTALMRELGYGKDYRYAHDESDAFAAGETYLPEAIAGHTYYHPVPRGLEIRIGEKLKDLRARNAAAKSPKSRTEGQKRQQD